MSCCRRPGRTFAALILWLLLAAGAQALERCPNKTWKRSPEQLQTILRAHQEWLNIKDRDPADPRRAILCNVDLEEAHLNGAHLNGAHLNGATLFGAHLNGADLSYAQLNEAELNVAELNGATLFGAELNGADLIDAQLNGVDLSLAQLRGADLTRTQLKDAVLAGADLTGATYAPGSAPPAPYVADIKGLETVTFPLGQEIGLVQLRKLLQDGGLREERQATYAIERNRTRHLLFPRFGRPGLRFGRTGLEAEDQALSNLPWNDLPWRDPLVLLEAAFRLVLFEGTVAYGLYPGQALLILLGAIVFFALIYLLPLSRSGIGDIHRIWPKGRLEAKGSATEWEEQIKVERLHPLGWWQRLGTALQFSVLSAFHLGWRELNVGTWLARLQTREYSLQATGWVRTVAGLQSLLSVYLLALWVLTYFGRPFG